MSQCPKCASTDVADVHRSDRMICLDCDFDWMPGARKKINRRIARVNNICTSKQR